MTTLRTSVAGLLLTLSLIEPSSAQSTFGGLSVSLTATSIEDKAAELGYEVKWRIPIVADDEKFKEADLYVYNILHATVVFSRVNNLTAIYLYPPLYGGEGMSIHAVQRMLIDQFGGESELFKLLFQICNDQPYGYRGSLHSGERFEVIPFPTNPISCETRVDIMPRTGKKPGF